MMNPSIARDGYQLLGPFVDGKLSSSACDATYEVINPSTGQGVLLLSEGSQTDVDDAVVSCRRAFDDGRWSDAPPSFRKKTLHQLANLIESHAAELDALDAEEMGKPINEQTANAQGAAELMRFYAEAIDKVMGHTFTCDKHSFVTQRRVPRGVVAAVTPWNFPTYVAVLKAAPALAAGNSVVLKPSELSSRSAVRVAQLAVESGLPPGVLNVVPGLGQTVGKALGLHLDVDMLTFTGSIAVGKLLLQYAGRSNMKVVMAECGGKSPHIIFADGVDVNAAAHVIAEAILINQGQLCSVGSRVLVHKSLEEGLIAKVAERMKGVVMGNALDPQTTFGPVASTRQCARVMEYIEGAEVEGAQLVVGGRKARSESGGFFVEPTVFHKVLPSARIAREEVFGPVLSVMTFEDEGEAIRLANSTMYGLMAYVWTSNLSRGMRMAKAVRSSVLVNAAAPKGEGPGHAFSHEPMGQSGIGTEHGLPGLESYLRRQLVWFNHD